MTAQYRKALKPYHKVLKGIVWYSSNRFLSNVAHKKRQPRPPLFKRYMLKRTRSIHISIYRLPRIARMVRNCASASAKRIEACLKSTPSVFSLIAN